MRANRAPDFDLQFAARGTRHAMIDIDEVRRIAALAHIEFDQAGLDQMARELSKILGYIDQLKEVDSASVVPSEAAATPAREDLVRPSLAVEDVSRNAPDFQDGFFVVPRVIGGEP